MQRRDFIKSMGALSAAMALPKTAWASINPSGKTLVLIELNGGNDSLNTFVPHMTEAYYTKRPTLSLGLNEVITLSENVAMNNALEPLKAAWDGGDMAVVQGLGYENPNRSHFRSKDIWNTASDRDDVLHTGWLADQLCVTSREDLQAVTLGGRSGPLEGEDLNSLVVSNIDWLLKRRAWDFGSDVAENPALAHVLAVQEDFNESLESLKEGMAGSEKPESDFPNTKLGRGLESVARLMSVGVRPAVFKLNLGGFDTHTNQRAKHTMLLTQLGEALATFREAAIASGTWANTTVVTYSEFGRRVAENGNKGTDHGTAATHFVLGGSVVGGIYGEMPSLVELDRRGDMVYTQDYRGYYRTLTDWLGWTPGERLLGHGNLGFLA